SWRDGAGASTVPPEASFDVANRNQASPRVPRFEWDAGMNRLPPKRATVRIARMDSAKPPGGAMVRAVRLLLAAGLAMSASGAAGGEGPPAGFANRPVRMIGPLPAGGARGPRAERHRGAPDRADHEPRLGTAGGDRKPARRQHHHRRAGSGEGGARRLHAVHGDGFDAGHEPVRAQGPALRPNRRLRADHAERQDHIDAGGFYGERTQERQGADGTREGAAGQAQLWRRHHPGAADGTPV